MSVTSTGVHLSPTVSVNGTPLAVPAMAMLVELRTDRAVRSVGRCTLRFADPSYELAESGRLAIGASVDVRAQRDTRGATTTQVFCGEVTGLALVTSPGSRPELVVTVEELAHRLGRDSHVTTYAKSSYLDILRKLPAAAGLTASVSGASGAPHEYVLQTDTDLALINDLTARTGLDWIVTDKTFTTWDPATGHPQAGRAVPLTLGEDIDDFAVQVTSAAPTTVEVRGFDVRTFREVVGTQKSRSAPSGAPALARSSRSMTSSVLDISGYPSSSTEASELAAARLNSQGNTTARGRLQIHPDITPGGRITLSDAGPASGEYYVREVSHTYSARGFYTELVAGDSPRATLRSVLGSAGGPSTASFIRQGTVVGVVTNITDPEKLGRVKVKFPVLGDAIESDWARVTSVGGGPARGLVATPEVNDEVLVTFENGDMRRPLVIGGLHNGKNTPSSRSVVSSDGKVGTRSLSSRLGHVVELSDGAGDDKQYVLLALAGHQHKLHVGKDRADLVVPADVPLTISAGTSTISFDGSGRITLKGTEIIIDADTRISLKAPTIDVAASNKVAVTAAAQAELSGAKVAVKGSAMTEITGGMVTIN